MELVTQVRIYTQGYKIDGANARKPVNNQVDPISREVLQQSTKNQISYEYEDLQITISLENNNHRGRGITK